MHWAHGGHHSALTDGATVASLDLALIPAGGEVEQGFLRDRSILGPVADVVEQTAGGVLRADLLAGVEHVVRVEGLSPIHI